MSSQTPTILVTGASGHLGPLVIEDLLARGVPASTVRAGARSPEKLSDLSAAGVTAVALDYTSPETIAAALDGVDTLFLVPANETADRVERHRTAVDAAVGAGVRRIVYLSFLACGPDATFTFARDHWHTEQHVRAAGVAFTFLASGG